MRTLFKIFSPILAFSLLLGVFFAPFSAQAGFLSSILGNEASADITNFLDSTQSTKNSQTMALLQANVSSIPILQDKKNKDNKTKEDEIKSDVDINIISENALLPAASRMNVLGGTETGDSYSDQISVYVVKPDDTLSQIAEMFDVSVNTILWANDMKKGDKLVEGDVLFILPISGIEHTITKGQTLKSIAKLYKADISDIARFNGITEETKLVIGDKIIVPGGEIYNESSPSTSKPNISNTQTRNIAGYFINPLPTGPRIRKTQGLHGPGNRGIDIGAPKGTPIYASAAGTVLLARMGWNGAYGNLVILTHPNGTKTLYAHMAKIGTYTGKSVEQGEVIGYVGSTGRSTGPHLHFEVFNAKNPGSDWSWAN
jgi:LysM repeat protein